MSISAGDAGAESPAFAEAQQGTVRARPYRRVKYIRTKYGRMAIPPEVWAK